MNRESRLYKKLILDPKAFIPAYEGIPHYIYSDALNAIDEALYICHEFKEKYKKDNTSEKNTLNIIKGEIYSNMWKDKRDS
tara:strand:+ start:104 stop:346 length:243 start_codon:yes stop_codon:yes gene_type:complete